MPASPGRQRHSPRQSRSAKAQLTLVEHALCSLDPAVSLQRGYVHETTYRYSDQHRNRKAARARIGAVDGLSAWPAPQKLIQKL